MQAKFSVKIDSFRKVSQIQGAWSDQDYRL